MTRKTLVTLCILLIAAVISSPSQSTGPVINVFKLSTCSCCNKWVEHLKNSGFQVKVQQVDDTAPYERQYRVPRSMESCHTAVVNGYAIEGHVPAPEIKRLLQEKPKAIGLAVPGMPVGSPGMEGARGEAYSVMLFDESGRSSVYARYPAH